MGRLLFLMALCLSATRMAPQLAGRLLFLRGRPVFPRDDKV